MKKIESVQLEASRIVTAGTRLVSLNILYMETDWEKLKIEEKNINLFNFTNDKKFDSTLHKLFSTTSICKYTRL
jgi:hypothetical protein